MTVLIQVIYNRFGFERIIISFLHFSRTVDTSVTGQETKLS